MEVAAATAEVRSEACIHRDMATMFTMVITDIIRDQEVVVVDRVRVLAIATRWFLLVLEVI